MAYLMGYDIFYRLGEDIIRHLPCPHTRVELGCLDEPPVVDYLQYVIVHDDGGIDDLAGRRVDP